MTPEGIKTVNVKNTLSQYDHLGEQTSWVEPYVVRDHSWSIPEHNMSDETVYQDETKAYIAKNHTAGDYGELDLAVSSNDSRNKYTENLQINQDNLGNLARHGNLAQYDHLHE